MAARLYALRSTRFWIGMVKGPENEIEQWNELKYIEMSKCEWRCNFGTVEYVCVWVCIRMFSYTFLIIVYHLNIFFMDRTKAMNRLSALWINVCTWIFILNNSSRRSDAEEEKQSEEWKWLNLLRGTLSVLFSLFIVIVTEWWRRSLI